MAGKVLPELRIPYRLYIGSDEGVYVSSPADGKVKVTADAGGADDIELQGGITLDGNIVVDTGHTFTVAGTTGGLTITAGGDITVPNDGTTASSAAVGSMAAASGVGWMKCVVGSTTGYIPILSSNCI